MASDDTIIINNIAGSTLERRTSTTGAVKMTIAITSEPLVHDLSPKALGAPVAKAIAETLRQKVRAIAVPASMRTIAARRDYEKGYAKNNPSALKRYAGGRIGGRAPGTSTMLFNDSGRFAESITANGSDDAWRVNVAANRLDERTAGGMLAVRRIWNRLVELVPAFGQPALLFTEKLVQDGLKESLDVMVQKAEATKERLTQARANAMINVARQLLGLLA